MVLLTCERGTNCSLSALVPKLKEQQVQLIIDRLSQFTDASNQNAELRDISSTGIHLPNESVMTISSTDGDH